MLSWGVGGRRATRAGEFGYVMQERCPSSGDGAHAARRARAPRPRAAACRRPVPRGRGAAQADGRVARRSAQGRRSRPHARRARGHARRGRRKQATLDDARALAARRAAGSRRATRPSRSARPTSRAGRRCCAWSRPRRPPRSPRATKPRRDRARALRLADTRDELADVRKGAGFDGRKLADARTKPQRPRPRPSSQRAARRRARRRRPRASTRSFRRRRAARRARRASARRGRGRRRGGRGPALSDRRRGERAAAPRGRRARARRGRRRAQTDATAAARRESECRLAANEQEERASGLARALRAAETRESKARAAAGARRENDALRDGKLGSDRSSSGRACRPTRGGARRGEERARRHDGRTRGRRARGRAAGGRGAPGRADGHLPSATNGNGSRTSSARFGVEPCTSDNAGRKPEKPKKAARSSCARTKWQEQRRLVAVAGLSYAQRQIAVAQGMSEADMLRQLYDDDD